MITNIYCNWKEFSEYGLDKKYNLVDCGTDDRHKDYKWLRDEEKEVNVYVR